MLIYVGFAFYMKRRGLDFIGAVALAGIAFVIERLTHHPVSLCAALFFAGTALAVAQPKLHAYLGRMLPAVSLVALLGVAGLCLLATAVGFGANVSSIVIFLGTPALLMLFASFDLTQRPLEQRWHLIGAITYSVYLLHMPVLMIFLLAGVTPPLWIFAAVVIAASLLSYAYFEKPAQDYLRRALLPRARRGAVPVLPE